MGKTLVGEKFGKIYFDKYASGSFFYGVVEAYSKNKSKFIRDIDSELWENIWTEKAQEKGIEYIHQGFFRKEIRFSEEIKDIQNVMGDLLELHNHSSIKYNELISNPVIQNRKRALNNIITNY